MAISAEIIEETELPALPPKTEGGRRRMILIAAAAGLLLLAGGGTGYYLLAGGKHAPAAHGSAPASESASEPADGTAKFVDVSEMVVNLRSPDGSAHFLKIHFMFVLGPGGTEAAIKDKLPLILDTYQPFLRELRPEDLAGSAAVYRIKEELLARATDAVGPGVISDILIQDLLQQ